MQVNKEPEGSRCPEMGGAPCMKRECVKYLQLRGTNPNTGEELDGWQCTAVWSVMLMIENTQQARQHGAAIESFRNEMVLANERSNAAISAAILKNPKTINVIEG
jgi:hypothetical protein